MVAVVVPVLPDLAPDLAPGLAPGLAPPPAFAASPRQVDCPGNLLSNPGFEAGFTARGRIAETVGNGWQAWYERFPGVDGINYVPDFTPRHRDEGGPLAAHRGLWSQEMGTENATHTAGLWQRRPVPPGSVVLATGAAYAWASSGDEPSRSRPPGRYALALGLDPMGGADPTSASIRWTTPVTVTDAWVPLAIEAPVEGSAVTLFARGQPLERLRHNVSRWDSLCLRVLGPIGESTPTATPRPWPTRTPGPDDPTPTRETRPSPDPATASALEIGLKLDLLKTSTASARSLPTEAALSLPDLVATRAALDAPDAVPTPLSAEAPEDRWRTARYALEDHLGLIALAIASLVGGLLFGLSVRRPSRARDAAGPPSADRDSDDGVGAERDADDADRDSDDGADAERDGDDG